MRRKKRSARPSRHSERAGGCIQSRAAENALSLANPPGNIKRRQGVVWLESRDALLPWGKPAAETARGRDKR